MPWPWNGNCSWDPQRELVGWSLEMRSGATGAVRVTGDHPRHLNSVRSLALSVVSLPPHSVQVLRIPGR